MDEKTFYGILPIDNEDEKTFSKFRISSSGITIINTISSCYAEVEEDYYCPTLKDLAIFLYEMCGQGVQWMLSRELSKRTDFDLVEINKVLGDIISEYATMSDKEATEKWEKDNGFIEGNNTIS